MASAPLSAPPGSAQGRSPLKKKGRLGDIDLSDERVKRLLTQKSSHMDAVEQVTFFRCFFC